MNRALKTASGLLQSLVAGVHTGPIAHVSQNVIGHHVPAPGLLDVVIAAYVLVGLVRMLAPEGCCWLRFRVETFICRCRLGERWLARWKDERQRCLRRIVSSLIACLFGGVLAGPVIPCLVELCINFRWPAAAGIHEVTAAFVLVELAHMLYAERHA